MSYTIRPATVDDAIRLHVCLSEDDKEELRVCQVQPLEAITRGVFDSASPVSIWDKHGKIAAIAGVVPVFVGEDGSYGAPWMLSTDAAKTEPVAFVKQAREWVENELEIYGLLQHKVYRHNESHIKLLKLIGFTVEKPRHPLQPFLPFHQCVIPSHSA